MGPRGELFSSKVTAESERRTYFFNVKENRKGDRFLTIVESTKQPSGEFERHQLFVYEEDLEEFLRGLEEAAGYMRKKPQRRGEWNEQRSDGPPRRERSERRERTEPNDRPEWSERQGDGGKKRTFHRKSSETGQGPRKGASGERPRDSGDRKGGAGGSASDSDGRGPKGGSS